MNFAIPVRLIGDAIKDNLSCAGAADTVLKIIVAAQIISTKIFSSFKILLLFIFVKKLLNDILNDDEENGD